MPELPEELQNRPARAAGQEPTATLTLDAYLRIKAELEELTVHGRERITEKIKVAREHGDLKENAEYHAAKDEQGLMESKIRKLQHMLRDPEIVEAPEHADEIGPGMLVTIRPVDDDDDDEETYLLAEHAEEKAPGARTVTTTSPLGAALVGAAAEQEVAYEAPAGTVRYVVVSFEPFAG
ncbi:MAG: GreA/GreB family elongation factor [Actinomycetota bacterium]